MSLQEKALPPSTGRRLKLLQGISSFNKPPLKQTRLAQRTPAHRPRALNAGHTHSQAQCAGSLSFQVKGPGAGGSRGNADEQNPRGQDSPGQQGCVKTAPGKLLCFRVIHQGCRRGTKPLSTEATCLCRVLKRLHFSPFTRVTSHNMFESCEEWHRGITPISVPAALSSHRISSTKAQTLFLTLSRTPMCPVHLPVPATHRLSPCAPLPQVHIS
ncbi:hypothetical protein HJG60_011130 [Phyllostomus discolor]|uniref:Uncharacterized protein n=1 Tax=Phyllostomus discolor TaxID=89673 RepID=A0A834E505_9CHIR|nr:hypothetical protein HJG60_011130 [Phyllostomus discolor]